MPRRGELFTQPTATRTTTALVHGDPRQPGPPGALAAKLGPGRKTPPRTPPEPGRRRRFASPTAGQRVGQRKRAPPRPTPRTTPKPRERTTKRTAKQAAPAARTPVPMRSSWSWHTILDHGGAQHLQEMGGFFREIGECGHPSAQDSFLRNRSRRRASTRSSSSGFERPCLPCSTARLFRSCHRRSLSCST